MKKLPKGKANVWGVKLKSPAQRIQDQENVKAASRELAEASKQLRGVFCEGHSEDDDYDGHWQIIQDILTLVKRGKVVSESIGMEDLRGSQRYLTDLYGAVSRANLAVIGSANAKSARGEKYVAQALFSDKGQVPTGTDNTTHVSRYCRHDDI